MLIDGLLITHVLRGYFYCLMSTQRTKKIYVRVLTYLEVADELSL